MVQPTGLIVWFDLICICWCAYLPLIFVLIKFQTSQIMSLHYENVFGIKQYFHNSTQVTILKCILAIHMSISKEVIVEIFIKLNILLILIFKKGEKLCASYIR
ncbi:MAG: hypothetical protein CVU42_10470 [Chloroflexi bacterium HGW-Chloroflexi-4]|nr:MAG: hypothetical protein CVU42_10470 [Chloroflexi bacterium HGW-Chloroflexi-4]